MMSELLDDGFGNAWEKCAREECGLEIVRPGKVQCWCDGFWGAGCRNFIAGPGPLWDPDFPDVIACLRCEVDTDAYFWTESGGLCGSCLADHGFMAMIPPGNDDDYT